MAEDRESTTERPWPRRTVLGTTGLALAGTLAACTDGDSGSETGGEARPAGESVMTDPTEERRKLPQPTIISTAEWGATQPRSHLQTINEHPSYLVIHHTTTPNVTDGSRDAAIDLARRVQNGHVGQGWGDSGQHFTMSRGGHILEARHGSKNALETGETFMLGIHALGFNAYALGIECEGIYMVNPPPQSLYEGLVHLCAFICQQYDLPPKRIIGHRDLVKTSCCGDAFYAKLPILRDDVRRSLEAGEYHVSEGFGADNLLDDTHVNQEYLDSL
ncbi:peptidoglycan recognition family protein [Micrococcus sp. FDAARGOS_333]|uniref:peptidoglycan recognition protein family protein n=1 Tax=Micrococcus sp. FDAARGOS_333 TaxID=1930558 RepID=UPI000B4E7A94|nr:peptidoglycan recognition family protein [Micrococcus sp. FDAARGOS_333]PNL18455.1 N-acetylmuramoyl-L-alanine amidase [Micrococcus sp. FDAARGOS_333]